MNKLCLIVIAGLVGISQPLMAADAGGQAGDAAAGQAKAAVCGACHGVDGNSINPMWPSLAGQGENYIIKQLRDFKEGKRTEATMSPQAANLTEQDMADLAAYFNSLTPKATGEGGNKLGQSIYRGGIAASGIAACNGCHSPTGTGNPAAGFPALAGQHATYTASQLKKFRASERSNDPGQMMRGLTHRLTDAEIDAVSAYIAGLQ